MRQYLQEVKLLVKGRRKKENQVTLLEKKLQTSLVVPTSRAVIQLPIGEHNKQKKPAETV
jgi:hypothetical protein